MKVAKISGAEVNEHKTDDNAWIVLNGVVWDVSGFASKHPGGGDIIREQYGLDGSEEYNNIHGPRVVSDFLGPTKRIGEVEEGTVLKPTPKTIQKLDGASPTRPDLNSIVNITQFESVAEAHLSSRAWGYIFGATEDGITNKANADWYKRIMFRSRILRAIATVDTSVQILGQKYDLPFFIAPTSSLKLSHPDGELATTRAAVANGVAPIVQTLGSFSFAEIMEAMPSGHPFYFQLYFYLDRAVTERLLKEVGKHKPQAILFTVDLPVISKRESPPRRSLTHGGNQQAELAPPPVAGNPMDTNIDWSYISWIKERSGAPVFLKGIQCAADARKAYEYGCAGIYISNHGGRALDTAMPSILVLLEIQATCPEILEKMEVFIDGGVRRGSDILKAICLGASGVLIGRPFLYSLQYGEEGARKAFSILREELEIAMQLVGITSLDQAHPGLLNTADIDSYVYREEEHPWARKIIRSRL
ncbi:related to CYB2-lactate dehydrogenase cytochrome b2 [Rhynchosporium agropyri]|uniref:Related to CYB2-lactate dehydrogenase cytochrome b2 n=1 Tax=Rhynchosporium agropyri TaxID=914238 RepID=A0A1E1K1U8_9HELO|nr:related to CYB2-lactate dehydrogenase cytochrome b2 [Rhynchosporium agropyri]